MIRWRNAVAVVMCGCAAAALASACDRGGASDSVATQRDSAGVTIVENIDASLADGGGWSIAAEPDLSIGAVEGDSSYQFFGISGAHLTARGDYVVVNAGSRNIRVYDTRGTFVRAFGQRGGGPEEFEMPVLGGVVDDTLLVVDPAHHRITAVHADAGIVRVYRVADEVGGFLNAAGAFADGQVVFGGAMDMGRTQLQEGLNRAHTFYRSSDRDGALAADFGNKMGADFYVKQLGTRGIESRPMLVPFGRVPLAAASASRFFFGSGDAWEIELYEPSGTLARLVRLDREPVPVTDAHVTRYLDDMLANVPAENRPQMRELLSEIPTPAVFPPYANLTTDVLGYLWVEDYVPPGDTRSTWTVLAPDGVLVGRVTVPPGVGILEIGTDYLLGVYRDELGVEYLHRYALERPEAP